MIMQVYQNLLLGLRSTFHEVQVEGLQIVDIFRSNGPDLNECGGNS